MTAGAASLPVIIQGGMGVAVSGWRLAGAVSRAGELGVVSGTALETVYARRLQLGDPGGDIRRALVHFPVRSMARRVLAGYYVHGGIPPGQPFRRTPMFTLEPEVGLQELTVVANFCEVFLAKEGHLGPIGINYLRKIELPLPFACLGAMLAGVDAVLVGAGNPADVPGLLRALAGAEEIRWEVRVQGLRSADPPAAVRIRPERLGAEVGAPRLPLVLAIVGSADLAAGLAGDAAARPDGFVVEGPTAGGHNVPPRGPRRVDALGQPVYDERDEVDITAVTALGLPVWLAGSYGTPGGLRAAQAAGARGIQVGTAFAYSAESGLADGLKRQILANVAAGTNRVLTDWRASPTGFPFKVVHCAGTLSEPEVVAGRRPLCDLGVLRTPYRTADGTIDYRCPAEPTRVYLGRKAGRAANIDGRRCICNALLATADLPQRRPHGQLEPPIVTSGDDFAAVATLLGRRPAGADFYPARAVVDYLRHG